MITELDEAEILSLLKKELRLLANAVGKDLEIAVGNMPSSDDLAFTTSDGRTITIRINTSHDLITDSSPDKFYRYRMEKAILQHQVAHIWFETDKAMESVSKLQRMFPDIKDYVQDVVNLVEDYRVDSIWQALLPGSKKNFILVYNSVIDHTSGKIYKPDFLVALLAARLSLLGADTSAIEMAFDEKLTAACEQFKKELKAACCSDWRSTYLVAKRILKLLDEAQTENNSIGSTKSLEYAMRDQHSKISMQDASNIQQIEKMLELLDKTETEEKLLQDSKNIMEDRIHNVSNEIREAILDGFRSDSEIKGGKKGISSSSRILETHKLNKIGYSGGSIKPNEKIKRLLNQLDLAGHATRRTKKSEGIDLNVDALIQLKAGEEEAINDLFTARRRNAGVSIWLLLDLSSSMEGDKRILNWKYGCSDFMALNLALMFLKLKGMSSWI